MKPLVWRFLFLIFERDKQTSEYWSKLFKKMPNLKSCLLPHGEIISEAEINELQSQQIPDSTVFSHLYRNFTVSDSDLALKL